MKYVSYEEIRRVVDLKSVIEPVRQSFIAYSSGRANIPAVQHLEMPDHGRSALHIKSGHVSPLPFCLVKVASTFPENTRLVPSRPSISGVIVLFSMQDGAPMVVLEDRAWITQIRTAGAGAVATQLLARRDAASLGVIGSGTQARLQTAAALEVRPGIERLVVWGRTPAHVAKFVSDIESQFPNLHVVTASSPRDVAEAADILITATYSPEPLVRGGWLRPGALVIAMGADSDRKLELDTAAIVRAQRVVVDSKSQNEKLAEIGFGLRTKAFGPDRMDVELGDLLLASGPGPGDGRVAENDIVVCKLTGVAVQEIFVCRSLLADLGITPLSN